MNLNGKQVIAILAAVLTALVASTAQLTDIFGPSTTKVIVSTVSLLATILNSILAAISGQANLLKDVAAMPGVDSIKINRRATQTAAGLAVDPDQEKIEPSPGQEQYVQDVAKGSLG
jgi:hypothetical protein